MKVGYINSSGVLSWLKTAKTAPFRVIMSIYNNSETTKWFRRVILKFVDTLQFLLKSDIGTLQEELHAFLHTEVTGWGLPISSLLSGKSPANCTTVGEFYMILSPSHALPMQRAKVKFCWMHQNCCTICMFPGLFILLFVVVVDFHSLLHSIKSKRVGCVGVVNTVMKLQVPHWMGTSNF
jgi:hypothetical protein